MTEKDDNTEMARNRTRWAEDRTVLANERTFAGWMRTGMAALAVALGLRAVFDGFEPTWMAKGVAQIFVVIAIFIFWAARNKACETTSRIQEHAAGAQPDRNMTLIATVLTFGAVATGLILWLL